MRTDGIRRSMTLSPPPRCPYPQPQEGAVITRQPTVHMRFALTGRTLYYAFSPDAFRLRSWCGRTTWSPLRQARRPRQRPHLPRSPSPQLRPENWQPWACYPWQTVRDVPEKPFLPSTPRCDNERFSPVLEVLPPSSRALLAGFVMLVPILPMMSEAEQPTLAVLCPSPRCRSSSALRCLARISVLDHPSNAREFRPKSVRSLSLPRLEGPQIT